MNENYKEVLFDRYCKSCKHFGRAENEEPCDDCLSESYRLYSHKPVMWVDGRRKREEKNGPTY